MKITKSMPIPACTDRGGYKVQPVLTMTPVFGNRLTTIVRISMVAAAGNNQNLRLLSLGSAMSGAPICSGIIQLAMPAAAGITAGCNPPANTKFCPEANVTRGQMAAFLVRALGLSDEGGGNNFTDDDGSVFETDIAKLAAAGITAGCNPPANTKFCPEANVTRGQMAAFLTRALNLAPGPGGTFTDDDNSIFEADIEKLATAGITKGCNPPANNQYCPYASVTRGEMAAFLVRALGL